MVPAAACMRNTNAVKEIMIMMAARDIDSDFVYCPKVQVKLKWINFPHAEFLELPYDIIRSKCHDWPRVSNNIIL
jgi:hypothetical protein